MEGGGGESDQSFAIQADEGEVGGTKETKGWIRETRRRMEE